MRINRRSGRRRMSSREIYGRLTTGQKVFYLLWPIILFILLGSNFVTLIKYGSYQMDAISHDLTEHMQIEFEKYLIPVETLLNGLKTNVEHKMDQGATAKEIESYLVEQTDLMTGDFADDSTGLYGYINGTYVDGALWVPPEGYDPEQRDWYKDTLKAGDRIAYVAPYIDMQSGDSSITVSRLLKDGKSVVALDLKVTSLQKILDALMEGKHTDGNDSDTLTQAKGKYIFILDKSGKIVVHTDTNLSGINVLEKQYGPFPAIVQNVLKENNKNFTIKYDGNYDSLTVISLNDEWYAIAAVDYYDTFGHVIITIIYTAIISLVVIILLAYALFKAAANAMHAEDDQKNTGALAGIYAAVYKVYPYEDRYERLRGTSKKVNTVVPQAGTNAQKFFYDSLAITTNGENLDKLREFVTMSTLEERFKDPSTLVMEYINTQNKWCRERFVMGERDENGKIISVLWVVEEIDAEKRSREELLKYSREMEQAWEEAEEARFEAENANKAKSNFLANMSHEIRTPINAVLGLDTMILRESSEEQIKKYALNIQTAGNSLLSIINDILDLSKIESGKMEIIPVNYDVASLISDVSNMIRSRAEEKGLDFNMNIDSSIPSRLFGDDVRIRQVLINLLTNAVKYTKKGSVTLSITGSLDKENCLLSCSVEDTGIGIAKEDIEKLYDAFVRIEEKKNRNIEGTGLGINIVSNLLNLMGSKLEVESDYGHGSKFSFTIKQKVINVEPIGDLEKRIRERIVEYSYSTQFIIPDADILVVDDNETNRYVFKSLLKELECHIDEADSGFKCLELAAKKKYDVIFMDHMMPEMDGIETFHKLKETKDSPNINTPVIVLTANAITGAKEKYLEEGFDDFLTKPIVPEKLEKLIGELIPKDRQKPGRSGHIGSTNSEKETTDDLPAVEGVDWDYAILKLKKKDILKGVLSDFRLTALSELKTLKGMYDKVIADPVEATFKDYRIKVHAMKNSAAMCGALQVSSLARVLEFAARDMDQAAMISLMPVFEKEWAKLKELLDTAFGSNVAGNSENPGEAASDVSAKSLIDQDLFMQYLESLENAMEELDTDTADAIIEEFSQYGFEPDIQEIIGELAVAVNNLDSEAASELIAKLK